MYPFLKKTISVNYPNDGSEFRMNFVDDLNLEIIGNLGTEYIDEEVDYTCKPIGDEVYILSWFEPVSKYYVVQVQNLKTYSVFNNLVNLNTKMSYQIEGVIQTIDGKDIPHENFIIENLEGEEKKPIAAVLGDDEYKRLRETFMDWGNKIKDELVTLKKTLVNDVQTTEPPTIPISTENKILEENEADTLKPNAEEILKEQTNEAAPIKVDDKKVEENTNKLLRSKPISKEVKPSKSSKEEQV